MDIKNIAANISLNGVVITLATLALFDSATNTPARKAPVTTDKPSSFSVQMTNQMPTQELRLESMRSLVSYQFYLLSQEYTLSLGRVYFQ